MVVVVPSTELSMASVELSMARLIISMAALLPNNGLEPILGTKIAGRPNRRSLVFILQTGVSADGRPLFESRSIESVEPVAPVIAPPANGKPVVK
jgi:hypothetical protein